jgi:hypothetical protein
LSSFITCFVIQVELSEYENYVAEKRKRNQEYLKQPGLQSFAKSLPLKKKVSKKGIQPKQLIKLRKVVQPKHLMEVTKVVQPKQLMELTKMVQPKQLMEVRKAAQLMELKKVVLPNLLMEMRQQILQALQR